MCLSILFSHMAGSWSIEHYDIECESIWTNIHIKPCKPLNHLTASGDSVHASHRSSFKLTCACCTLGLTASMLLRQQIIKVVHTNKLTRLILMSELSFYAIRCSHDLTHSYGTLTQTKVGQRETLIQSRFMLSKQKRAGSSHSLTCKCCFIGGLERNNDACGRRYQILTWFFPILNAEIVFPPPAPSCLRLCMNKKALKLNREPLLLPLTSTALIKGIRRQWERKAAAAGCGANPVRRGRKRFINITYTCKNSTAIHALFLFFPTEVIQAVLCHAM